MNRVKSILKYARAYWGHVSLNLLFNIISNIFSVFSIVMIIPILQLLFEQVKPVTTDPGIHFSASGILNYFNFRFSLIISEHGRIQALVFLCITIIIIFFLKNLFRYAALYAIAPMRHGIIRNMRNDIFSKVLFLPVSYFTEGRKGDIMSRCATDVQEIDWSIMYFMESVFNESITVIITLVTLIYISPQLTLFVLLILPVSGLIIGRIGKTLKRESIKGQGLMGDLLSLLDETISGNRIIKAFNAEKYLSKKFTDDSMNYYHVSKSMQRKKDLSSPLSEFLGISVVVAVLYYGGSLALNHDPSLQAPTFITFVAMFSQIISPAKSLATAYYNIQKGLASVERIQEVMNAEIKITEKQNAASISSFNESIELKNISFSHVEGKSVLQNIQLRIEKGKVIALVGPSGAGKSTLADMLPRFFDPTTGTIEIDGKDIRNYRLAELRKLFGMVTQDAVLFNDTLFNNIAFGLTGVTQEEVERAAKVANAHNFILKKENGYQTLIGDRGNRLSGGERQRITIARAVLRNPAILILDEATSSLDTESEQLVQEALNNLMKNHTAVVIAHRLSTVQHADEIIVMNAGRIEERGTHQQLMLQNGLYKKLVDLQAFA
ncbi:MAG TPA: antibiotic ABC transporter ATP-binding protein [Bacteroidetes bacterium]|nr:antibiotic ABC transporter ATP-binding protein [Bacteroidota bacterium]